MNTTINQRIKEIADKLCKGNISELARVSGVKQSTLRDIATGKQVQPGYDTLNQIAACDALQINAEWLLTGKGAMQTHRQDIYKDNSHDAIPVFNIGAAGNLYALFENKSSCKIGEISIPKAPKCDGAIYVLDNGMYPLIKANDMAVYKQLHNIDNLLESEMYLIDYHIGGDDFMVVRYVKWEEKNSTLCLVSYNERYDDMIIPVTAVRAIAHVKMVVRISVMV